MKAKGVKKVTTDKLARIVQDGFSDLKRSVVSKIVAQQEKRIQTLERALTMLRRKLVLPAN